MTKTILRRVCRKCGATIFPDAGICGACFLERGLGPIADEENETSDPATARMVMDFGDYELLEEIGRGGQGVVYRARQRSLNRLVALKVIGLGHWATEAHVRRFRLEAEAAARLDHPGIVPIYEVGERDGSCYFSMKFVEGGQLDAIVRREPLSIRRAVELAAKLARTVQYAHDHGILHRDIKPGNVLLDKHGEAHLTDFGLAKLVETESAVTNTFDVIGTPSYMAPEQAAGKTRELSAAADVYGLGAVFYQLLTGQPPFAGGTTYETIRLVMETEPRRPSLWNSKVDRDLETIALKCLGKNPQKRYATALALAEDLERWLRHEPISARRTGIFARTGKWIQRNPAAAVLVPSLVALAVALGVIFWNVEPAPPTGIAVLPFENLSAEKENAFFADGVQDDILTKLAKVADLKVISRTSVMQYRGERNVRKIGNALRVSHVLEGSVRKTNGRIRLNAQLIDTRTDAHVWAEQYEGEMSEVFAIQNTVAQNVVSELRSRISLAEKSEIEKKPTQNLEAYDLYLRAKEIVHNSTGQDPDWPERLHPAADMLEQAVALDPNFGLAYCLLAEVNLDFYWDTGTPPVYRARAEAALQRALRLAPNAGETHLVHALFFYWVHLDYDHALEELERAARSLPNSAVVFELSSWIERRLGRWKESVRHNLKAIELDPLDRGDQITLMLNYIFLRHYDEAMRVAARGIAQFPEAPGSFYFWRSAIALEQGDTKLARDALDAIPGPSPGIPFFEQWRLAFYERNYAEAEHLRAARKEPEKSEARNPTVFFEAMEARVQGKVEEAHTAFLAAREKYETWLRDHPPEIGINSEALSELGLVDAGLGRKEEALAECRKAIDLLPVSHDALVGPQLLANLAKAYAWLGERDRAIEQLSPVVKLPRGPSYGELKLDPLWDKLRDDPRFVQILAEAAKPIPLQ